MRNKIFKVKIKEEREDVENLVMLYFFLKFYDNQKTWDPVKEK